MSDNAKKAMRGLLGYVGLEKTEAGKPEIDEAENEFYEAEAEEPVAVPVEEAPKPVEKTVIASGTVITGDIVSDGDFEVLGAIKGNLSCSGRVKITGKVGGNVNGGSVILSGCRIKGNVTSETAINVDESSAICGDMSGADIMMNGRIKGNVLASNVVSLQSNAVIVGDITAARFNMADGTRLSGNIKISCKAPDMDDSFEKEFAM